MRVQHRLVTVVVRGRGKRERFFRVFRSGFFVFVLIVVVIIRQNNKPVRKSPAETPPSSCMHATGYYRRYYYYFRRLIYGLSLTRVVTRQGTLVRGRVYSLTNTFKYGQRDRAL